MEGTWEWIKNDVIANTDGREIGEREREIGKREIGKRNQREVSGTRTRERWCRAAVWA